MLLPKNQSGQGLVDYALVIILVTILVVAILAFFGPEISNFFRTLIAKI